MFGVRPDLGTHHTLTNPFTEVVDHSAPVSILAAGLRARIPQPVTADREVLLPNPTEAPAHAR